jgi:hypothetical protein
MTWLPRSALCYFQFLPVQTWYGTVLRSASKVALLRFFMTVQGVHCDLNRKRRPRELPNDVVARPRISVASVGPLSNILYIISQRDLP